VPWATEDSISQCPFLQMTYTAENPHADGSAAPGARPHYRPPRHRDLPATSRTHDNWMAARQTSCRQQTAPPQLRCSKDVTAHPHRPGARPGCPCPVLACSGQPPSGRSGFSSGMPPFLPSTPAASVGCGNTTRVLSSALLLGRPQCPSCRPALSHSSALHIHPSVRSCPMLLGV